MTSQQRTDIERRLRVERASLLRGLRRLDAPVRVFAIRTDASPGDEGDTGAVGVSSDDDAAIAAREQAALEEIDLTLELLRTEPERFGVCAACGDPIEYERLRFVPTTRLCTRHAPRTSRPPRDSRR